MIRKTGRRLVLTFHTTADAMATEKYCKQQGIPGRLIPVPRELTSDCGIAWSMEPKDAALVAKLREFVEIAAATELDL